MTPSGRHASTAYIASLLFSLQPSALLDKDFPTDFCRWIEMVYKSFLAEWIEEPEKNKLSWAYVLIMVTVGSYLVNPRNIHSGPVAGLQKQDHQ